MNVYRAKRPMAMVIDQRHIEAVEKITYDKTVRISTSLTPKRLNHSVPYSVDHFIYESELNVSTIREIFSLDIVE